MKQKLMPKICIFNKKHVLLPPIIKKMKIIYIYSLFTIASDADRVIIEKTNYLAKYGYDITSPKVKLYDLGIVHK